MSFIFCVLHTGMAVCTDWMVLRRKVDPKCYEGFSRKIQILNLKRKHTYQRSELRVILDLILEVISTSFCLQEDCIVGTLGPITYEVPRLKLTLNHAR